jgi:protein SCO1/2
MNSLTNRTYLWSFALACAGTAFLPTAYAHGTSLVPDVVALPTALGGDFELQDTDGRHFRLQSMRGKVVLLYFGYTGCPDACPTEMLLFQEVMENLGVQKSLVQPLFVSVDPARDKPAMLSAYVGNFGQDIRALTGTEKQLRKVAKAYGAHFSFVNRISGSTHYTVDHSVSIYVVDPSGQLVSVIPFGTPAADVLHRVKSFLPK